MELIHRNETKIKEYKGGDNAGDFKPTFTQFFFLFQYVSWIFYHRFQLQHYPPVCTFLTTCLQYFLSYRVLHPQGHLELLRNSHRELWRFQSQQTHGMHPTNLWHET